MPVDGPRGMVRCECVIHQGGEFFLGPLAVWGAVNKNDTESREYFWAQIQSKRYNQSDTIKVIPSAIRSEQLKQYDQQYNQDDPSDSIGYIINIRR